jgi:hypothetical protein
MAMKDTVTSVRRTNIGCTNGTGRIIGITTIATTTRIDASVAVIGFFVAGDITPSQMAPATRFTGIVGTAMGIVAIGVEFIFRESPLGSMH